MAADPRTPVIIGVGQFLNRDDDAPIEPAALMVEALRAAEADSGAPGALASAQVVAVVPVISWRYQDPGALVGPEIGAPSASTWYPAMGGNTPQMLVNRLAVEIAEGRADIGVVTGGEAYRTRVAAKRRGDDIDWTQQDESVRPTWSDGGSFLIGHPAEVARGILMPTQAYPMFESALWHESGRSMDDHLQSVGEMWAGFSKVAAANPYAWGRESFTGSDITTPTTENRIVGYPYTKRMVSNPDVNMASGLIMCSVERARSLGVHTDRWVFPHAGTDGYDTVMSERTGFASSPAIAVAGNRALELAGASIDDITHLDLYSCFPSAVQIGAKELTIPLDRQLTVYGGLSFAGGPWNNPVGHALASMVGVLRDDPGSLGLVTANGGNVEKHAFGVYSTDPPAGGFRHERPQDEIDRRGRCAVVQDHHGPATIEAWTVMHERDGSPARAHAACRIDEGVRTWGVSRDPDVMKLLETEDVAGRAVSIGDDGEMVLSG